MNKITVSIIIPVGKGLAKYLPETIESVLAQTIPPTEIIVIFDGEDDIRVFPGVTTVHHANFGVIRARNEGYLLSKGDNLIFLDADDVISENYVEAMIQKKLETGSDIIYPNVLNWNRWKEGENVSEFTNHFWEVSEKLSLEEFHKGCPIVVSSMIGRKVYRLLGGFPNYPILEDYALWYKAMVKGYTFSKADRAVLKYRNRRTGRNNKSHELKNQIFQQVRSKYAKEQRA